MIIHDCLQRSESWFALRCGRITGTRLKEMVGGKPPTFELLCKKIASEKITGVSSEKAFRITDAMQEGIDREPQARAAYEMDQKVHVREVGFIERDSLFGVSPDGLLDDNGLIEIKNPLPSTHLEYLLSGGTAWRKYRHQILGQLWVSGREYCDFVSYHPDFPHDRMLLIERVEPDPEYFRLLESKADQCHARINEILEEIQWQGK